MVLIMNSVIFKSQHGNLYLKSFSNTKISLLHPAYEKLKGGNNNSIEFKREEIIHQNNKRKYLESHKYFDKIKVSKILNGKIDSTIVRDNINGLKQLAIELTESCNMKCSYCINDGLYEGQIKRSEKTIDFKKIKKILMYLNKIFKLKKRATPFVISFYGGEPLLRFELIKRTVEYVNEINFNSMNVEYSMTTNGILLNKHIDYLIKKDFSLLISLDGNANHNSLRILRSKRAPSYNLVVSNLEKIRSKNRKYFEKKINFNSVFHKLSNFDEIVEYFKSKYNKIPLISNINSYNIKSTKKEMYKSIFNDLFNAYKFSKSYKELNSNFNTLSYEYQSMGRFINSQKCNYEFKNKFDYFNKVKDKILPTGTCSPFTKRIFITCDGLILPCERIPHNHVLGKINESCVTINFDKITKYFNQLYNKAVNMCKSCFNFEYCETCMLTDIEFNKCNNYLNEKKYKEYISEKISYIENCPKSYLKSTNEVYE